MRRVAAERARNAEFASTRLGLLLGWPITRVTTSSSSSYCRDWGGSSTLSISSSSKEDWSSVEPVLLSLTASSPGAGARSGGSGRRQGLACLHFLLQIELWAPRVQTPLCLGSSGTRTAGLTRENHVHKQGFSGAERTQRQALTMGAISPLTECSRRVPRSQASHALLVCVSSSDETFAGRHTRLEQAWLALALIATLRHSAVKCNQCSVLSSAGLCISCESASRQTE